MITRDAFFEVTGRISAERAKMAIPELGMEAVYWRPMTYKKRREVREAATRFNARRGEAEFDQHRAACATFVLCLEDEVGARIFQPEDIDLVMESVPAHLVDRVVTAIIGNESVPMEAAKNA